MSLSPAITPPDLVVSNAAVGRAADILLRSLGGLSVLLRIPAPATPADPTEQLGLATPSFQDLTLAPVVFRRARATVSVSEAGAKPARWELLVSASVVQQLTGSLAYASASTLFAGALGILSEPDGELLTILSATSEQVFNQPYVYRLILEAQQSDIL